ncbi:MAG: hypothetical protein KDJ38_15970 [Gammaproteobacteria bacterium]|nr:hypothetical protein [Gammaproteobacteria bacterium]
MLKLATYAMRGPLQAALPATLFLLLTIFIPPVAWLSGAVIGLVFLRKGIAGGVPVFVIAAVLTSAFTFYLSGSFIAGLQLLSVFWIPVVVLALFLRETVDLARTLLLAGLLAMVVVLGMYLLMGDPAAYWEALVLEQFPVEQVSQQFAVEEEVLRSAIAQSSHMMSGAFLTVMMLGTIISLLIARYWQAGLYNPGGFRSEFHGLRFGALPAALAVGVSVLAILLGLPVFVNVAPIAIALFFFQGLAVFHGLVDGRKMNKGWLIGIYGLLFFLFPHTVILLGALGMADNWLNLRKLGSN